MTRMSLLVGLFFLVVLDPVTSSWSPWSAYGPCMKTCGQGISLKRRMCQSQKQEDCPGDHTLYKICNDQPCPDGNTDIRSVQCKKYNQTPYRGKYLIWTSTVDPKDPCTLICRAHEGGHQVKIQSVQLDGMECGNASYCLGGSCLPVGCDKVFGSNTVVDICGVCGGINATCDLKSGTKTGKYYWKTTWGPCSVTCGTGYQEADLRCASVKSGRGVEESHCVQTQGWIVTRKQCTMPSCEATPLRNQTLRVGRHQTRQWRVGEFGPCSKDCGGGVQYRRIECIQGNQEVSHIVENKLCPLPAPETDQVCNNHTCGSLWSVGQWTPCSTTCGQGQIKRSVICMTKHIGGSHIAIEEHRCTADKPETTKNCFMETCKTDLQYVPLIRTDNSTYIQLKPQRSISLRVGSNAVVIPKTRVTIRCPVKNFPPHIVNWKKNNEVLPLFGRVRKSMKGALKIRFAIAEKDTGTYTCFAGSLNANSSLEFQSARKAKKMAEAFEEVDDDTKKMDKTYKVSPEIIADASRTRHKKVQYLVKGWSPCSNTCGFGTQTRAVNCAIKTESYIKLYPEETCNRIGLRKPDGIRKCVEIEKCPVWKAGEWSNCTTDYCIRDGFAVMKRLIQCISPDGSVIDHKACLKTQAPEHKRVCENPNCLALWRTEKWTGCRPYCGPTRYKFRILSCVWKHSKKPAGINCRGKARPHIRMACESTPCINVCRDKSRYCSLVSYLKMCRYPQFRVECCRSCSNHVYWRNR